MSCSASVKRKHVLCLNIIKGYLKDGLGLDDKAKRHFKAEVSTRQDVNRPARHQHCELLFSRLIVLIQLT